MLQANFSTWRGHTVGMCRTLTALGVLYHNYRIINTPLPSQEGLYRMHDAGCREHGGCWGGGKWGGGAECRVHPLAVMGCELVQCNWPLQQVLYGHFRRKQGSITSTLVQYSQYCFLHTVVPSPFPWTGTGIAKPILILRGKRKHWQSKHGNNLISLTLELIYASGGRATWKIRQTLPQLIFKWWV